MKHNSLSSDFASRHDFLNCFKSSIIFSFITFITLSINIFSLISKEIKFPHSMQEFVFFDNSDFSLIGIESFYILLIILGVFSSIKLFSFLWKTEKCNVYLSLPITRSRLYLNRLLASISSFTLGIIGAFILGIVLNTISFGFNKVIILYAIYNTIALIIPAMLGFTISSSVCVSVGKKYEAIIFSIFILTIPNIIIFSIYNIISKIDNGITLDSFDSYLEPYMTSISDEIGNNFSRAIYPSDNFISGFKNDIFTLNFKEDIIPILVPLIMSLVFVLLAILVLYKRKPQIANTIGANKFLIALIPSVFLISRLSEISIRGFEPKTVFSITLLLIITSIITGVICYAIYKNKKQAIDTVKLMPIMLLCSFVLIGATSYSQKLKLKEVPDVDEIERAYAVASGCDVVFRQVNCNQELTGANMHDTKCGELIDKDDLKIVTDIHKSVQNDLGNGIGTFKVLYFLKDGSSITRAYHSVGNEASKETYKLYDTKAYKEMLKYYLTVDDEQYNNDCSRHSMSDNKKSEYIKNNKDTHSALRAFEIKDSELFDYRHLVKYSNLYLTDSSERYSVSLDYLTKEQKAELKKQIYNEYSALSLEERFFNNEKPVYYLAIAYWDDGYQYNGYSALDMQQTPEELLYNNNYYNIPIYASMTNTLDYIDSLNIDKPKTVNTSDIECVYLLNAKDRYNADINEYNDLSIGSAKYCYNSTLVGLTEGKHYFETKKLFEEMAKGKRFDNSEYIKDIYTYSRLNVPMLEDNGYVALFKMNDYTIFLGYIRESDIKKLESIKNQLN